MSTHKAEDCTCRIWNWKHAFESEDPANVVLFFQLPWISTEGESNKKIYKINIIFWPLYKFQGETFSLLFVLVPAGVSIV